MKCNPDPTPKTHRLVVLFAIVAMIVLAMLTITENHLVDRYRHEYATKGKSARQAVAGDRTGTNYRFKPNSDV
jgi:hypothetical protein